MSSDWNIPNSVSELFESECQYWIHDIKYPMDNIDSLQLFLGHLGVNVPIEMIEKDSGTQAILFNGTRRIVIDSSGNGDFHRHRYDVTFHEDQPVP
jgi:hypothetical protein